MKYGSGGAQLNTPLDFWAKVSVGTPEECWPWKEGRWTNGYGRFKYRYQSWRAHRFALVSLDIMPEVSNHVVRHLCRNKLCCNPKHLVWGTQQDNVWDYLKDFYADLYQQLERFIDAPAA